jgi:hypothetical protein
MAKTSKSKKGQYRITTPHSIMTVFNLGMVWSNDWISVQGLPALKNENNFIFYKFSDK